MRLLQRALALCLLGSVAVHAATVSSPQTPAPGVAPVAPGVGGGLSPSPAPELATPGPLELPGPPAPLSPVVEGAAPQPALQAGDRSAVERVFSPVELLPAGEDGGARAAAQGLLERVHAHLTVEPWSFRERTEVAGLAGLRGPNAWRGRAYLRDLQKELVAQGAVLGMDVAVNFDGAVLGRDSLDLALEAERDPGRAYDFRIREEFGNGLVHLVVRDPLDPVLYLMRDIFEMQPTPQPPAAQDAPALHELLLKEVPVPAPAPETDWREELRGRLPSMDIPLAPGSERALAAYLDAGDHGRAQHLLSTEVYPELLSRRPFWVRWAVRLLPRLDSGTEAGRFIRWVRDLRQRPDSAPVLQLNGALAVLGAAARGDGAAARERAARLGELVARSGATLERGASRVVESSLAGRLDAGAKAFSRYVELLVARGSVSPYYARSILEEAGLGAELPAYPEHASPRSAGDPSVLARLEAQDVRADRRRARMARKNLKLALKEFRAAQRAYDATRRNGSRQQKRDASRRLARAREMLARYRAFD